jgi:hypothetical protein
MRIPLKLLWQRLTYRWRKPAVFEYDIVSAYPPELVEQYRGGNLTEECLGHD